MNRLRLCNDDPVVDLLRNTFHANIARVPTSRIQPLEALGRSKNQLKLFGSLSRLLDRAPSARSVGVKSARHAEVSNQRSRKVGLELGIGVLAGILKGFGIETNNELQSHIKGAWEVSFHFGEVSSRYIELASLGKAIAERKVDFENPAARPFADGTWALYVVDSALSSATFDIEFHQPSSAAFELNLPDIAKSLKKRDSGLRATVESDRKLKFQATERLTFAFTCVELGLSRGGAIRTVTPSGDKLPATLAMRGGAAQSRTLLTRHPEMVVV